MYAHFACVSCLVRASISACQFFRFLFFFFGFFLSFSIVLFVRSSRSSLSLSSLSLSLSLSLFSLHFIPSVHRQEHKYHQHGVQLAQSLARSVGAPSTTTGFYSHCGRTRAGAKRGRKRADGMSLFHHTRFRPDQTGSRDLFLAEIRPHRRPLFPLSFPGGCPVSRARPVATSPHRQRTGTAAQVSFRSGPVRLFIGEAEKRRSCGSEGNVGAFGPVASRPGVPFAGHASAEYETVFRV